AKRFLRRGERAGVLGGDDLHVRILGERHARGPRGPGAIDERDLNGVARLAPRQGGRDVAVVVDPVAIDLLQLVVLIEARGVDGPGRRYEPGDARAAARLELEIAEPRASGVALAHREAGTRQQPR